MDFSGNWIYRGTGTQEDRRLPQPCLVLIPVEVPIQLCPPSLPVLEKVTICHGSANLPFAFVHLEYNDKYTLCPKALFHVLPDTPTVITLGSLLNTWNCTSTTSPPTSGSQAPGSLPGQIHPAHALGVTQPHPQEPRAWPASSLTQKRHRKPHVRARQPACTIIPSSHTL